MGSAVFHQFEYLGHGGLTEFLRSAQMQHARHVHAPAQDLIANRHLPRERFSREGCGIERRAPFGHDPVDRHFLAGQDYYYRTRLHIVGVHAAQAAVSVLDIGIIGADVHEGGNAAAALAHRIALEEFTYLIEEHYGYRLQIIAAALVKRQGKGAQGGDYHKEVLVEDPLVAYAQEGFAEDVVAYQDVDRQIIQEPVRHATKGQDAGIRQQSERHSKHGGACYAGQHYSLLPVHSMQKSGSTFLALFITSAMTASVSAPSSNSTFIF